MNAKTLANHYSQLTPDERFRLIMAASSRGDETERKRLMNAAGPIRICIPDHGPYAHAFHDLLFLTYIELLEDSAHHQEMLSISERYLAEARFTQEKKRNPTTASETRGRAKGVDSEAYPAWHRKLRVMFAVGFSLKAKYEGWTLFCTWHNTPPNTLWELLDLPGLDRLKRSLIMIHAGAAFPSATEMVCWVNENRPVGDRDCTEADLLSADLFADGLEAAYRERVSWWSGN